MPSGTVKAATYRYFIGINGARVPQLCVNKHTIHECNDKAFRPQPVELPPCLGVPWGLSGAGNKCFGKRPRSP